MDINKIFAELGRLHLEVMQLREQLAEAQARLPKPVAEQNEQSQKA